MTCVLLVPAVGDPYGLLTLGKCGTRPPRVIGPWFMGGALHWVPGYDDDPEPGDRVALVLAWDGKIVLEGIIRAWFHADDVGGDVLIDLLDGATSLDRIAAEVAAFRRNDQPLGGVVIL